MPDQNVIEKIQKLLALADEQGGGTEAERLNAAEKAQDLLLRHNLDLAQIEERTGEGPSFERETMDFTKMADHWRGTLASVIGETVNVHVHYRRTGRKSHRSYFLVGREDSIQYVRSMVDHLAPYFDTACESAFIAAKGEGEQMRCGKCKGFGWIRDSYTWAHDTCPSCKGEGQRPVDKRVFRSSFYNAAIFRVGARLEERQRKYEESLPSVGTDLIRNDAAALTAYVNDEFNIRKAYSRSSSHSKAGAKAGATAGANADLSGSSKLSHRKALTA